MLVINNWIKTNIRNKISDKNTQLEVEFNPYYFKEISFSESCIRITKEIKTRYKNIYLSLSGGTDSCFVLINLVKAHVNFTPVIIKVKNSICNTKEIKRALIRCEEYEVKPEIITVSEKELMRVYREKAYKKANCLGVGAAHQLFVGDLALKNNGVVITGEHAINDATSYPEIEFADYNFLLELLDENIFIPFYLYSIECLNATLKIAIDKNLSGERLKVGLYGLDYLKKVKFNLEDPLMKLISSSYRFDEEKIKAKIGSSKDLYDYLTPWRMKSP